MKIKQIKITDYVDDNELIFSVDYDKFTEDIAWVCGEFWGWDDEREDYDDVVAEYLKMIAELVFNYMDKCYSVDSVIRFVGEQEGYITLDGSIGVYLVKADLYESKAYGMEVSYE